MVIWDADAGLYYYRARWYDPAVGRFLSEDPIGFAGGDANRFRYAENDPVNLVDPRGLWTGGIGLGGTAGAGGAVGGSAILVFDGHGNIGVVESGGGGGMGGINASGASLFQVTNADSIYDLKGFSTQTGGSFGEGFSVGGEYVIGPGYTGVNINVGIGGGLSPAELHSVVEYGSVQGVNLFDMLRYLSDLIRARQAATPCF